MAFNVTNIIDGKTIEVGGWRWDNFVGTKVRIVSFDITNHELDEFAKSKLTLLLLNKSVDLVNPTKAEKGIGEKNDTLYCTVLLDGVNIVQYFPEISSPKV
jgi:hypothetical protein